MKRKCENCELTGTQAKVRRISRDTSVERDLNARAICTERKLVCSQKNIMDLPSELMLQIFSYFSVSDLCQRLASVCMKWSDLARHPSLRKELSFSKGISTFKLRTNIMDLPPELMLQIFSYLSLRDICQSVAPVCTKWSILARHPCLRQVLYFYEDISTSNALKLLRGSPLLRRLRLRGRRDSDAILQQVFESNRLIETIEMIRCRGSVNTFEVNGDILGKIIEECTKFSLYIVGTNVKSVEFYTLLGRLDNRMTSFFFGNTTKEEMLCYLKARAQLPMKQKGILNGESKDVKEIIDTIVQNSDVNSWTFTFTD
jgi:hypothetical protein